MGTVDGVDVSKLEGKFNTTNDNVAGIKRDPVAETTTIEGDFAVNGKDNTVGSKNGSFTVNAEDGTFTAANGAFKVREGVGETVIAGSIISSKDQFGNQGTFNGSNLNLQSADHTRNTSIDAGTAYFVKDGSGTSIDGGDIYAETLNGKVIDDLVEGSDIADDLANVSGITRTDENNDGKLDTTTIEGSTSFDAKGMVVGDNAVVANVDGSFSAANRHFNVAADGTLTISGNDLMSDRTVIGAGYVNIADTTIDGFGVVTPYVEASAGKIGGVTIEEGKVDGVDVSEIGAAVGENGKLGGITREDRLTNITGLDTTVIEDSFSVNKENINMFGDNGLDFTYGTMPNGKGGVNVAGNINFDADSVFFNYGGYGENNKYAGSYTLEDLADTVADIYDRTQGISYDEDSKTTVIDGNLEVNDPTSGDGGEGNPGEGGNNNFGNGNFDGDVNADNGNFRGDVTVGGDVTAVDGNFSGKVTVGGEGGTSITGDGMTVGTADKGTTVSDSGVSIKNEYGSVETGVVDGKNDVVVTDEDGNRTSLVDTAGRVDNLEQGVAELNNRVGELEDRIDKVGAMAAAIANLRTMGYDPAAPTEVAVGIGQYRDETGAALGLFHYPNRDFMLSLSVSTSGDEVMGGIGATWKFGRKSPEKVAEIKKAQAEADARRAEEAKLAKAEEMKQAAKEAKIKAQQERHAKLAAERAAQAEAAK